MGLEEKIKELEDVKYKIKRILFKIKELKMNYFPSKKSEMVIHSSGNTSQQEIIVTKIDSLERELQELQLRELALNEEIEQILDNIKDEKARWIVLQKVKGKAWCELETEYSVGYAMHVYKKTLKELNNAKNN